MATGAERGRVTRFAGFLIPFLSVALAIGRPAGVCAATSSGGSATSTQRLVADALKAEAAGESARRRALLDEAVRAEPNNDLARWSRGELRNDGEWLPVEAAQQAAATDPRHLEYFALRADYGDQPAAQLELARWCRRNNLDEEAKIHWANVLSLDPNNREALRALGAEWFDGRLMTYAQIDAAKRDLRDARHAAKKWNTQLDRWQRMLSAGDVASRNAALDEVREVSDPDAIPAIEAATLDARIETTQEEQRCHFLSLAFVDALGEMPVPAAAASLARHAVLSPIFDVRDAAIERLKERPMIDYVPLLLDSLAMPVESAFQVTTDPDGSVHYRHSLYIDGRRADWLLENSQTMWQLDLGGRRYRINPDGSARETRPTLVADMATAGQMAKVAVQSQQRFGSAAVNVEQQVAQANEAAAAFNRQVTPVLVRVTGQDLGEDPQAWWSWWRDYNEYYAGEGEDPVYERRYAESSRRSYRPPTYNIPGAPPPHSCFARGTLVWTNTGKRAIETLEIGDLVLSQNVETGELAYQPVVGRTVRPPCPVLKLTLDGEELTASLGHPLWVSGVGWRMAKQVDEAAVLHGVHGPVRVDAVEPASKAKVYNLILANNHTYFVGESGILVHDNTLREPTAAVVPGLAAE